MIAKVSSRSCVFLPIVPADLCCRAASLFPALLQTMKVSKTQTSEDWEVGCYFNTAIFKQYPMYLHYRRHFTEDAIQHQTSLHPSKTHRHSESSIATKNSLGKEKQQLLQLQISSVKQVLLNFFQYIPSMHTGKRCADLWWSRFSLTLYLNHSPANLVQLPPLVILHATGIKTDHSQGLLPTVHLR